MTTQVHGAERPAENEPKAAKRDHTHWLYIMASLFIAGLATLAAGLQSHRPELLDGVGIMSASTGSCRKRVR